MTKYFFLFLFILGSGELLGQNKLEWNKDYRLQADDFKAPAPNTGTIQTVQANVMIEYQMMNYEMLGSKNFNRNVSCSFYPESSWLDKGENTEQLLRYTHVLFDIQEWQARELRKRFRENRSQVLAGKHSEIYEQIAKEATVIMSDYSKETDFGRNEAEQTAWEEKIKVHLEELAEYCKTCKPGKKK